MSAPGCPRLSQPSRVGQLCASERHARAVSGGFKRNFNALQRRRNYLQTANIPHEQRDAPGRNRTSARGLGMRSFQLFSCVLACSRFFEMLLHAQGIREFATRFATRVSSVVASALGLLPVVITYRAQ